jgi:hypothetical protein
VSVQDAYWDTDVTGISSAPYGSGYSTADLQCATSSEDINCFPSLYTGWDNSVWGFGSDAEYPYLISDIDQDGIADHLDVDIDNDGLIEVSTLSQLDLIRYDLAGTSLNGDSTGCPLTGCNGYELVADLDFDTNGNGVADAGDLFWNNGEGWNAVGDSFSNMATFNLSGNGHEIKNLFIDKTYGEASFLGYIHEGEISQISFISPAIYGGTSAVIAVEAYETMVNDVVVVDGSIGGAGGSGNAGGLFATAQYVAVAGSSVNATIVSTHQRIGWNGFGGIIGYGSNVTLDKTSFSGSVDGGLKYFAGGLVGFSEGELTIRDSVVTGDVVHSRLASGGLVGASWFNSVVERSLVLGSVDGNDRVEPLGVGSGQSTDVVSVQDAYWDTDVTGISSAPYGSGYSTADLQCATSSEDMSCYPSLYSGWDETIWDFGTSYDYPVLR